MASGLGVEVENSSRSSPPPLKKVLASLSASLVVSLVQQKYQSEDEQLIKKIANF
jgi:hypothetical protein